MSGLGLYRFLAAACWVGLLMTPFPSAAEPPITALAFDPVAKEILSGSQIGVVRYSWPALQSLGILPTKLAQVHHLAFSPDGKTLALAGGISGEEGVVELWNWPNPQNHRSYVVHADVIYDLVWSGDSKWVFTASHDGTVNRISSETGKIQQTFRGHSGPVTSVTLLPDQKTLVSAGTDQTIRVWKISTGEVVRSFNNHTQPIRQLALRPSSDSGILPMVATIAADRTLRLWQPTIGRMVRFLRLGSAQPLALAWSPDGKTLLVTESTGQLKQIDPDTLEILSTHEIGIERPIGLVLTSEGTAAVVAGKGGKKRTVRFAPKHNP
ncbi:MAG: WD40 repeat domain-containing protein [Planctomycetaceae bacterium]|nr:WD40 repeat domain-containing protein [Planctomycetaceae bacterium]